jgi:hypothetical protein
MKLTGENRRTRGKTCPSATLSTTNPTCTGAGSNPGLRGERPATNRLSHGTAFLLLLVLISNCLIFCQLEVTSKLPSEFINTRYAVIYIGVLTALSFVLYCVIQSEGICLFLKQFRVTEIPNISHSCS